MLLGATNNLRQKIVLVFIGIIILTASIAQAPAMRAASWFPAGRDQVAHVVIGKWLKEHFDATKSIAVNDVGAIAYFSDLQIIDILGLNNEYIAMHGPDPKYVFGLKPTLFLEPSTDPKIFKPTPQYATLWNDPEFKNYRLLQTFPYDSERTFFLFERFR